MVQKYGVTNKPKPAKPREPVELAGTGGQVDYDPAQQLIFDESGFMAGAGAAPLVPSDLDPTPPRADGEPALASDHDATRAVVEYLISVAPISSDEKTMLMGILKA